MLELILPVTERDHIQGSLDAPVTLLEYGDYECPHCTAAYLVVKTIQEGLGDELRFAYRHFPLIRIHPHAEPAAEAAEAAGARGRFWEMHAMLYENSPNLSGPELLSYAEQIGLEADRFVSELRAHRYIPRIQADMESGLRSGVKGTPTFFINGIRHRGGYDLQSLLQALRAAQLSAISQRSE
jgi:protein-disulfide isomerase